MIKLEDNQVSVELVHVDTCLCKYVYDIAVHVDVKLIDTRCIKYFHVIEGVLNG